MSPTEIALVWIDDGCILCGHCVGACPEVFDLGDDGAEILAAARIDGLTSVNRDERSGLGAVGLEYQDGIRDAAATCPIDIIRVETAPDPAIYHQQRG